MNQSQLSDGAMRALFAGTDEPSLAVTRVRPLAVAYGQTIFALIPLNILYFLIPRGASDATYDLINTFAPFYFISTLGLLGYRVIRSLPDTIWSAAFWIPVQSAAFFGFGPLVEVLGNEVTRSLLSFGPTAITPWELLRSNSLSTLGVTMLLVGFWLHISFFPQVWRFPKQETKPFLPPILLGFTFALAGGALRYLFFWPAHWGMIDVLVPGVLSPLSYLIDLGFGILAFYAAQGNKKARTLFWLFWPIHFLLSLLFFSKRPIVTSLLVPVLGAYLGDRSRVRLFVSLSIIAVIYTLSQPYIKYGRDEVYSLSGNINHADYFDRIEISLSYFTAGSGETAKVDWAEQRQGWWTRLNYAGPQAKAMDLYDQGFDRPEVDKIWMYFIPRILWPEKPIMGLQGLMFYRLVTENPTGKSFLGLSIYGDLYWQYGWIGVVAGCLVIGWLFAMMAWRSTLSMRRREFIMLPAVFFALNMTIIGTTSFVSNAIIGGLPIYVSYYVAARLFLKIIEVRRAQ